MRNRSAFGLLEVVISTAAIGIAGFSVVYFLDVQRKQFAQQEKREFLHGLLEDNVAEIHSRKISSIPDVDTCLSRYYSVSGNFIREQTAPLSDAECKKHTPSTVGMKVVWAIRSSSAIGADFTPSSLKLPQVIPSLRQITVYGGIRPDSSGQNDREYSLTVYKRIR